MSGRRRLLAALLLLAIFAGGLAGALSKGTSELGVYVKAGERMTHGESIYVPAEDKPFTYPPFFAMPFIVFAMLPERVHRPLWYMGNVLALLAILWLLWRRLAPVVAAGGRGPPAWIYWVVVALLAGRHVTAVFENQSHDLLVMLAVVLAVTTGAGGRWGPAGAWAGVGAALKATPLLFAPVYLWQRRPIAALTVVVTTVALTLLPDLVFPRADGNLWVVTWYEVFVAHTPLGDTADVAGAWSPWNILNQNLSGTIHRLSAPPPFLDGAHFDVRMWSPSPELLRVVKIAAQLAVLVFLAFVLRPSLTRDGTRDELSFRRLAEGGAIVAAMVLLSPMSSKSHFCVLLLPVAVGVADYLYRRRDPVLAALLVLVFGCGTLTMKGIWGGRLGNEFLARGSVTACAVACLLASGHVLDRRRQHGREAALGA